MSIITFASLKGGVGKTSVSVNIAAAFAHRGLSTLLIDLDPSCHASRLFKMSCDNENFPKYSPLAKLFFSKETSKDFSFLEFYNAPLDEEPFVLKVRENLELIPATRDLKYFVPAHGSRIFAKKFPYLLEEFSTHFDHIIIDTPPDFNILTRAAIASADIVVSPIDPSEMGIRSAEELLESSRHLKAPAWAFLRTMVNSRAKRTHLLSNTRLGANLFVSNPNASQTDSIGTGALEYSAQIESSQFLSALNGWITNSAVADEMKLVVKDHTIDVSAKFANPGSKSIQIKENESTASKSLQEVRRPVYLLDSTTYRTESQNQLSFMGKTSFDLKGTFTLSRQYLSIAKEIEEILVGIEDLIIEEDVIKQDKHQEDSQVAN